MIVYGAAVGGTFARNESAGESAASANSKQPIKSPSAIAPRIPTPSPSTVRRPVLDPPFAFCARAALRLVRRAVYCCELVIFEHHLLVDLSRALEIPIELRANLREFTGAAFVGDRSLHLAQGFRK